MADEDATQVADSQKKTLKLKREEPEQQAAPAAAGEPQAAAAPAAPAGGVGTTVFAVLGLVAVVLFAALLLVQWMELSFYTSPPSVFPR